MYLGTRKFYDPEQSEKNREALIATKQGAVVNTFIELEGLLNKSQLAAQYFGKSQAWLSQRINGCLSHGKRQEFSEAEFHELAEALRHVARRLAAHADEIDAAAME